MTRFQVTLRCTACGHKYKRVLKAESELELQFMSDPPCPICTHVHKTIGMDVGGGKAPGVVGSLHAKAIDATAQIVMEDHNMTDLRDNVHMGESAAPKLPPRLQAQADNMFTRPKNLNIFNGLSTPQIIKAASSGAFMTKDTVNPVVTHHASRTSVPINIIARDRSR